MLAMLFCHLTVVTCVFRPVERLFVLIQIVCAPVLYAAFPGAVRSDSHGF